jgi:PTS system nitrogen regulatory IIA component
MGNEDLSLLLSRGGVVQNIPGSTPREILEGLVAATALPASLAGDVSGDGRERLLKAVLERESLMPTALGSGIALPHPRNPVVSATAEQFVAIGYPEKPVDWNALDGKPVHTVILIVSSSPREHLETLSRINFFCREPGFRALLDAHASLEKLVSTITEQEKQWH